MTVRFFNAYVLTFDDNNTAFNGEVWVENDKIVYAGLPKKTNLSFDREIDLNGNILMPGFKNCHTHSPMTLFRSYADDLPLDKWLFEKIFPLEDKLCGEDVYWGTLLAVLEYLSGGTTAVADMYFLDDWVIKAMADGGMRCVFVKGMSDLGKNTQKVLDECESMFNKHNGKNPLIKYALGVHAEYTVSRDLLDGAAALSKKYCTPVSIHLSESKKEVADCKEKYGRTPPFEIASHGVFDNGGMAYHCVHIDEKDAELLKSKNVSVVINPASNLKLANGIAPLQMMIDKGINVAIGTDGAASNNALDMFREMYLASVLQKAATGKPEALPAETILKMAVKNGAYAMGFDDCDCIAEGKQADLIAVDIKKPNMQPIANLQKSLVFSAGKSNVFLTMIGGKILYENGKYFMGIDENTVYAKCNEIVRRIVNE